MASIIEEYKAQFRKPNNALIQLILINVSVFVLINLLALFGTEVVLFVDKNIILPKSFTELLYKPWALFTYMFHHLLFAKGGFSHLFQNMLALWFFGGELAKLIDGKKIISIYLLGGLFAGFTFLVVYNFIPYYMGLGNVALVGASGSVFAISVALPTLSPRYGFNIPFVGKIEVRYIVLVFILISVFSLKGSNAGGEVAHLGGALMGWIYARGLKKGKNLGSFIEGFFLFVQKMFKPKPKMKVTHHNKTAPAPVIRTSQEDVDAILDKIKDSGYASLSKTEKQKLFDASEK